MPQAIEGVGLALGMGVAAFLDPALIPFLIQIAPEVLSISAALVLEGIASLLRSPVGTTVAIRQPQAYRTAVYGRARMGGTFFPVATTDGAGTMHLIVIHCDGPVEGCNGLYFDGRQVFVNESGDSIDATYYDNEGNAYNFHSKVHWEFFDGTQTTACATLVAANVGWDASCVLNGICYSYLRLQYDVGIFPSGIPGIRADIVGKNDIYDPRTGLTGYTENWALCVADFLCHNPDSYGLGCNYSSEIDQDQLIAAANICDEAVALAGPPLWQANQQYYVGQSVNGGGYMQVCTQAGTSGATAPSWNATLDGTTGDGSSSPQLQWQNQGSATGLTEPRYAMNGAFSMDRAAGDILNEMMTAAAGRIVYIGGTWKIFPAAWAGPSLSLTDDDLIGPIKWSSKRKYRDLVNGAKGTFVCPVYPYLAAGPGLPLNQKQSGVFNGEWQPTDFPPYCQDALHGYASDANYTADGSVRLWLDTRFPYTISAAAVQRLAKIMLLRNRQQGLGSLPCKQTSLLSQTLDVIEVTHSRWAANGWTNKLLEVAGTRLNFKTESGRGKNRKPPRFYVELDVQETDPSVYAWSTSEELTIEDGPSPAVALLTNVATPATVTLESGPAEVIAGADGVKRSQILVSWDTPTDLSILNGGSMELQYQQVGTSAWTPAGTFDAGVSEAYIGNVNDGQQYLVRLRCISVAGVPSNWVVAGPITVSNTYSEITTSGLSLNIPFNQSNDLTLMPVYSGTTGVVGQYGFEAYGPGGPGTSGTQTLGDGSTVTIPPVLALGQSPSTSYTVFYIPSAGNFFCVPLSDTGAAIPDGYLILGSFTTMGGLSNWLAAPGVVGGGAAGGMGGPRAGTVSPTPVSGGVNGV